MASIRKMKGSFYARIIIYLGDKKQKEILIPLKTQSKTQARTRLEIIGNQEENIKDGILKKFQFSKKFKWLNPEGTSRYESLKLKDIIPEYLKYRKCVVRKGSYERDYYALLQLTRCLGDDKVVQNLTYKDFEQKFIPYYRDKGYLNSGLNCSLRTIKIFLNYLLKEKLTSEPIKFKMLPEDDEPCFINRNEIEELHNAVDDKFRRWFYFYEMVGCRAKDPFKGFLDGNIWKISPDEAKTKHWHYYPLTDELKYIWMEMQDLKQSYLDKGKGEEHSILMGYNVIRRKLSATFMKLRKKGKIAEGKKLTLKSFRHTFGIINVHITRDIWKVSKMMNHKEIGVTQEYLDIPQFRIEQEFPELKKVVPDSNLRGEATPHTRNALSPHTPSTRGSA